MGLYLIAASSSHWWDWWVTPSNWLYLLMMAAGLGVLIFVHELGHFVVAKACGVKCEKFYLGFDIPIGKLLAWMLQREKEVTFFGIPIPKTFAKFRWGETEYGIGVLPLGGYVKMLGQDDNPAAAARERERSMIKKEAASGKEAAEGQDGGGDEQDYVLDPRSYQAKNVPQRMAIISAGVIMNMLTAPLFATAAYMIGVDYTPCVVGEVVPGGPAYEAGVRPRDRILELGGYDHPYEHLRFGWDLRQGVAMVDEGQSLKVLVQREDGTQQMLERLTLKPRRYYEKKGKKAEGASIGIVAPHTTEIYKADALEGLPAAEASPPLEKGDVIVGVRPAGVDGEFEAIHDEDGIQFRALMIQYADRELELKVERKTKQYDAQGKPKTETLISKVKPNPFRDVGLIMRPGAIEAIYAGSPGDKAGFKTGDRIKTVAGETFGGEGIDPMLLTEFLRPHFGKPIQVEVERKVKGEVELVTLDVTPEMPGTYDLITEIPGVPMSCAALGICYQVTLTVDAVRPDSPADKQGLEPGDKLTEVAFLPRKGKEADAAELRKLPDKGEPVALGDESTNLIWLFHIEQLLPDNAIKLTYERDSKQQKPVVLQSEPLPDYNANRGFAFDTVKQQQTADSLGEAFALGLRETTENFLRVLVFLKKLVTGGISPTALGGPLTIGVVATSEASQGPSSLLLFMTFLSVNLAIVNFLPIPVLDGGHMMFLLYELVFRKPMPEKVLTGLTLAGFAFILGLMLFVFGLDVMRFTPG